MAASPSPIIIGFDYKKMELNICPMAFLPYYFALVLYLLFCNQISLRCRFELAKPICKFFVSFLLYTEGCEKKPQRAVWEREASLEFVNDF